MKDIQTRQQVQRLEKCQEKRRRKSGKLGDLIRKGGETVEKAVNIICWIALICFVLLIIGIVTFVVGMAIYFQTQLKKDEYVETYSEWQRMEDEIQMQALKEDAKRREAKKREKEERRKKRRWKKRNS